MRDSLLVCGWGRSGAGRGALASAGLRARRPLSAGTERAASRRRRAGPRPWGRGPARGPGARAGAGAARRGAHVTLFIPFPMAAGRERAGGRAGGEGPGRPGGHAPPRLQALSPRGPGPRRPPRTAAGRPGGDGAPARLRSRAGGGRAGAAPLRSRVTARARDRAFPLGTRRLFRAVAAPPGLPA